MEYLKSHMRPWVYPTLATVGFLLLLMRKSEFPAVFNWYSIDYTILLILSALNLGLFWRLSLVRGSYRQLIKLFSGRPLISIAILVLAVALLIDFIIGIPSTPSPSDWVNLALVMGILIQAEGLRRASGKLSGNLTLCACSLALTTILVELIFVLFLVEKTTPQNQEEFLRLMSSQWSQPIPVPKPPGTFRILGLSDSFGTWGGITNYHYLLEDILRQNVSPMIQMINISVEGYDTLQELAILRYGIAYSPDLVLHGFFVGNDFSIYGDNVEVYKYLSVTINKNLHTSHYRPRHFGVRAWIKNTLKALQEKWRRDRELTLGIVDTVGEFSKRTFLEIQLRRMEKWAKPTHKDVDRMKKVFPVLDAIRKIVKESGARYVMVIHPDQTQVDEKLRQNIVTTYHVNEQAYDFDLPQKLLRSYCEDRGIPCLDLLPSLLAKAKGGEVYLARDSHYNHTGNALAATNISKFLQSRQFLANIGQSTDGKVQAAQ